MKIRMTRKRWSVAAAVVLLLVLGGIIWIQIPREEAPQQKATTTETEKVTAVPSPPSPSPSVKKTPKKEAAKKKPAATPEAQEELRIHQVEIKTSALVKKQRELEKRVVQLEKKALALETKIKDLERSSVSALSPPPPVPSVRPKEERPSAAQIGIFLDGEDVCLDVPILGAVSGENRLTAEEVVGRWANLHSRSANHAMARGERRKDVIARALVGEDGVARFRYLPADPRPLHERFWITVDGRAPAGEGNIYWGYTTSTSPWVREDTQGQPALEVLINKDTVEPVTENWPKDKPACVNISPLKCYGEEYWQVAGR